ncbi:uncharacterized protein si:zfos-911d5.4 [Lampris incognitus]|uniref:uncharacterized protein si:zfos-911d5.4 n=1 Tax=Lampris incognitus TaxID=2546036 RepID=UPI0024B5E9FE|nr:uncharacterized protein si:zfos-911d5.4 [Lampris incognitus]
MAVENAQGQSSQTTQGFLQHVRQLTGLKKEDVFCNLRIPNQMKLAKDDINIVLLTGQGIFCIDVNLLQGSVSAHNQNWYVQVKEEDQDFTNICMKQVVDPLKAIMTKTVNLFQHLNKSEVPVQWNLFSFRVVFLSPDCELDKELKKKKELVSHSQIHAFFSSFREGYMAWISDALTPSWMSGHLSYKQMEAVRGVLRTMGTWDVVRLCCGEQLKGDYQSCQYIALNRQETDTLVFSRGKTLSAESLWVLLGHVPQITVKMYKRGAPGWLGKPLAATATIPPDTHVIFKVSGEEEYTTIPASTIHSITLSI